MKTPEQIKKGMECAENARCPDKSCVYFSSNVPCNVQVQKDALALIRQLEAEKAELLEKIKQLERERDAAIRDCARFPCYTCKENGGKDNARRMQWLRIGWKDCSMQNV